MIYPLAVRAHLSFRLGRWAAARAEAAESVELAQDTGQLPLLSHSLAALAYTEAALAARRRSAAATSRRGSRWSRASRATPPART